MIAYYLQIKWVHVAAVFSSGGLFLLRGLLVWLGHERLAMRAPVRYLSYSIDSVLLTAALMLLTILPGAMFANGWLTVKILLLLVYVVLGTLALKRGRTPRRRAASYIAALLVYAFMISIAWRHHPLGLLQAWLG